MNRTDWETMQECGLSKMSEPQSDMRATAKKRKNLILEHKYRSIS